MAQIQVQSHLLAARRWWAAPAPPPPRNVADRKASAQNRITRSSYGGKSLLRSIRMRQTCLQSIYATRTSRYPDRTTTETLRFTCSSQTRPPPPPRRTDHREPDRFAALVQNDQPDPTRPPRRKKTGKNLHFEKRLTSSTARMV